MSLTKVLFTCDLHGSNIAYRKFVNAIRLHKANVAIIGGDITGKFLVPFVKLDDDKYRAVVDGKEELLTTSNQVDNLIKRVGDKGGYAFITEEPLSPDSAEKILQNAMSARVKEWVHIAEQSLRDSGTKFYVLPGNDDLLEVDSDIGASDFVVNPEGKVVRMDDFHEMISTGFANLTPWNCPRDVTEDVLAGKIHSMIKEVEDPQSSIFNFHCPPYDTVLDVAAQLDRNLTPVVRNGQIQMANVGSTAVRDAILEYQPLLGLFGHIHEARGHTKLGRTLCLNPGSEYSSGVLSLAVINFENKKGGAIKSFWLSTAM